MGKEKYYEKLSLEEAEKQIREIVILYKRADAELEDLKSKRDAILGPYSSYEVDKLEPEKKKEYRKLEVKIDNIIKHDLKSYDKLYDLVRTIPIPKNKRTCANCFYTLCRKRWDCEKRKIVNKVYCDQYVQPHLEEGMVLIRPYFMTEKERAIEAAKTFEDHVNDMVKSELDTYKKTLKQLDEHLSKVEVEETTIAPQDILDKFEREEKQIHDSIEAWGKCYDHEVVKEGFFKGFHKYTPNKEKFKKLLEKKDVMCPMQAVAASVGLTKVPKKKD